MQVGLYCLKDFIAKIQKNVGNGILFAFEGIDGSGKTTHAQNLATFLKAKGLEVVTSKEPTDGPWGKRLRDSAFAGRASPSEELELFIKDRKEHVSKVIGPALSEGKIVIVDRYYFSTMAYQGARGLDPVEIRELNEEFAPIPQVLFLLDLPVSEAVQRINIRDGKGNEFETIDNLKACEKIFSKLVDDFVCRVPSSLTVSEVDHLVEERAEQALNESDYFRSQISSPK